MFVKVYSETVEREWDGRAGRYARLRFHFARDRYLGLFMQLWSTSTLGEYSGVIAVVSEVDILAHSTGILTLHSTPSISSIIQPPHLPHLFAHPHSF